MPRLPWRRRALIVLLAVATAITVVWAMLERPGGIQHPVRPPPADAARCALGQTQGCVGGRADIILLPQPARSGATAPASLAASVPR